MPQTETRRSDSQIRLVSCIGSGIILIIVGALGSDSRGGQNIFGVNGNSHRLNLDLFGQVISGNLSLASGFALVLTGFCYAIVIPAIVAAQRLKGFFLFIFASVILVSLLLLRAADKNISSGSWLLGLSIIMLLLSPWEPPVLRLIIRSVRLGRAVPHMRKSSAERNGGEEMDADLSRSKGPEEQGSVWNTFKSALGYDFFLPPGAIGEPAGKSKRVAAAVLGALCFYASIGLYRYTFDGGALITIMNAGLEKVLAGFTVPIFWILISAILLVNNDRKADFAHVFRSAFLFNIFMYTIGKLYNILSLNAFAN